MWAGNIYIYFAGPRGFCFIEGNSKPPWRKAIAGNACVNEFDCAAGRYTSRQRPRLGGDSCGLVAQCFFTAFYPPRFLRCNHGERKAVHMRRWHRTADRRALYHRESPALGIAESRAPLGRSVHGRRFCRRARLDRGCTCPSAPARTRRGAALGSAVAGRALRVSTFATIQPAFAIAAERGSSL